MEMKNNLLISLKLTLLMIILCSVMYPLLISVAGKAAAGGGDGETVTVNNKVVGYANIGQKFTDDKYFWSRPSAVDYNAAGSAGSNNGPSNPDYLKIVSDRIDSFLVHNPGVKKEEVPAEMVTASGSGLDPDISLSSAHIQVKRIAKARDLDESKLKELINRHLNKNPIGPDKINVLQLNVAMDAMK